MEYEKERVTNILRHFECQADQILSDAIDGRPNTHSSIRDLLIVAHQQVMQASLPGGAEDHARERQLARKITAQSFGLNCGTRLSKTARPSLDQVRRAQERTSKRFLLIRKIHNQDLLSPALDKAILVLGHYLAELTGKPDQKAFARDASHLVAVCRLADTIERLQRWSKYKASIAQKTSGVAA
jgi:hypothetical protein